MGLKNRVFSWFLTRKIKNIRKKSATEESVDELLAEEMKNISTTNRTIDKLLKVKLMRQESQNTIDKLADLDADRYEEEEEEENFEETIKKVLMAKILRNVKPQAPEEDFNGAPQERTPQPQEPNPLLDAVNTMTPEQMKQLKGKFLN